MALTEEQRAELEQLRQEEAELGKPKVPLWESGLQGFGQQVGFGFGDEILSAIEAISPDVTYEEALAENRGQIGKAQEANPKAFMTGQILGGIASTAPLAAAAPAAGVLRTIATEGAIGAGQGALTAAGTSEKELTDPEFYKEVAQGTAIGGLAGAGGAALGKGVGAVAKKLKGGADDAAGALKTISQEADETSKGLKTVAEGAEETLDELDDFADAIPVQAHAPEGLNVPASKQHDRLAKFGKYVKDRPNEAAENIAYLESRPKEVLFGEKRIHLDPNQKNNFQNVVLKDYNAAVKRAARFERDTGEILKGVPIKKQDVLKPFQDAMGELSGKTDPNVRGTVRVLLDYLEGVKVGETQLPGLLSDAPVDAKSLRTFIRDLRSGNVKAYEGGAHLPVKPRVLKRIAAELNKTLKKSIARSKGAAEARRYSDLMEGYAADWGSVTALRDAWDIVPGVGPTRKTWYDTHTIHPLQKIVDGDRSGQDAITRALLHIGRENGNDYLKIVKDNFVLNDLFPELSSGIDRGTWTRTTGRAANASFSAGKGNVLSALKEGGGAALDVSEAVRRNMLKKILMGQKGMAESTERFVGKVKDLAEGAQAPLSRASQAIGELGEGGERLLHGVGLFGSRELTSQEPTTQESTPEFSEAPEPTFASEPASVSDEQRTSELDEAPKAKIRRTPQETPSTRGAPYPHPERMGKYSGVLRRAKEAGEEQFAVTHNVLMQRDPEYRKKYEEANGER